MADFELTEAVDAEIARAAEALRAAAYPVALTGAKSPSESGATVTRDQALSSPSLQSGWEVSVKTSSSMASIDARTSVPASKRTAMATPKSAAFTSAPVSVAPHASSAAP